MAEPEWVCVYCGLEDPDVRDRTRDHVPPKNLFPEPRPSDLITVPCCRQCNSSASEDDEYFRVVLTSRIDTSDHPEAEKVRQRIFRSLQRPEATGFTDLLRDIMIDVDVHTPSGIYLGKGAGIKIKHERLNQVAERIVRGLYWYTFQARLPNDWIAVCRSDAILTVNNKDMQESIAAVFGPMLAKPPARVIGNHVFKYWYKVEEDCEYSTVWFLRFYGGMDFICGTIPVSRLSELADD